MSDTGKQSPLGVNSLNALLNVQGLQINPKFVSWMGTSHNFPNYTFGRVVQETVLRVITHAIHEGYYGNADGIPYTSVYNNLISIGGGTRSIPITSITSGVISGTEQFYFDVVYNQSFALTPGSYVRINSAVPGGYNGNWLVESGSSGTFRVYSTASYGSATTPGSFVIDNQVPGLGNAKAMVYTWEELIGRFGTGTFNLGDTKGWGGSTYKNNLESSDPNPATQWAYLRLLPLQAWMEFNYNSTLSLGDSLNPAGYRDFLQQWQSAYGFIGYSNNAILSVDNSKDFLSGTFSNMNDLITADITNVSLATKAFGQDLITLGKAIDLSTIATYGLPSNLLKTLVKYNALTKNLSLAIISAGIPVDELGAIISNVTQPNNDQERKLYAAYYITVSEALTEVLVPLNCKTAGLESLADLLNPKKMFPNSYNTLTVPVYNMAAPSTTIIPPEPTPPSPVTPTGVTIDTSPWVFNNTSPATDFYQLTSTTTNNFNIGPGRCTFEFTFKSDSYFVQNPGGHFAVVTRCNNSALASGYVQGQGIVIGNVSEAPTPTNLPPNVPFAPNPAHPSTQIESFWAGVAVAPNGTLYYANTLLPNTNGANPVLLDGVEYKFTVISEISESGKSYTGYNIMQGTTVIYNQPLVYDYNIWYDPTKSGIVIAHVFENPGASAWSVTVGNKVITWSPVGGVVVTPPTPPTEPIAIFPNSKVYYPIYVNGSINSSLTSAALLDQIGTQTPVGTPLINDIVPAASPTTDNLTELNNITQTSPAPSRNTISTQDGSGRAYDTLNNQVR